MTSEANTATTNTTTTSEATSAATNKVTSAAKTTPESFEMTLSVIAAMEKSRDKAIEEVRAIQAANPGKPFAPGLRAPQSLAEALNEALRTLKPDAHQIARANGWALPEGV